ncbi:MAG: hypothetical protein GEV10_29485 [Streptosporangiales bacterium]|nr:hypothetical protein [Streptosporangiales bacterium]
MGVRMKLAAGAAALLAATSMVVGTATAASAAPTERPGANTVVADRATTKADVGVQAICSGRLVSGGKHTMSTKGGTLLGTVYVYYNSSTGKNCLYFYKAPRFQGTKHTETAIGGGVSTQQLDPYGKCLYVGGFDHFDCGAFTTYAGPISFPAKGRCIDFGASITINQNYYYGVWRKKHCG